MCFLLVIQRIFDSNKWNIGSSYLILTPGVRGEHLSDGLKESDLGNLTGAAMRDYSLGEIRLFLQTHKPLVDDNRGQEKYTSSMPSSSRHLVMGATLRLCENRFG